MVRERSRVLYLQGLQSGTYLKKIIIGNFHFIVMQRFAIKGMYLLINIHKDTKPTVFPMSRPYTVVCLKMVIRPSPCGTKGM